MHQTAQPCTKARFPITRRQSHGFISPEIKATIIYHQPSQPWFRSPDNTVMFSVTRHQRHCFISSDATAMGLSIPWFHSPDAKATVSCTRHHSHGFIHQTPQPWFNSPDTTATFISPDTTVTASFTSKRPRGFKGQKAQDFEEH